jgi:hypothetical protein
MHPGYSTRPAVRRGKILNMKSRSTTATELKVVSKGGAKKKRKDARNGQQINRHHTDHEENKLACRQQNATRIKRSTSLITGIVAFQHTHPNDVEIKLDSIRLTRVIFAESVAKEHDTTSVWFPMRPKGSSRHSLKILRDIRKTERPKIVHRHYIAHQTENAGLVN